MAEPPYKRVRRPDSKQMWDEADRRNPTAPLPTRERDEPRRDDRRDDRKDNRRRYRSRSPRRDDRRGDDRDRDRGGRRDNDRSYRERGRDGGRDRGMYAPADLALPYRRRSDTAREDRREKPRAKSGERKGNRSRSPGRERERDRERDTGARRDAERGLKREDREKSKSLKPEEELVKSRTGTPPVNFKMGGVGAQDHDRMDVDSGRKSKESAEATAEDYEEEEEDDIIIEDDGMAAMQAMMGFGGFATTQNQKVAGNDISAIRKEKKTEYRQYMNRQGGFNRPLSPTRD